MKTTPMFNTAGGKPTEMSRRMAVLRLRLERSRRHGKVWKVPSGYLLSSQHCFVVCPKPERPRATNPEPFSLDVFLTHKYAPGWKSLDESHRLGTAKTISSKPGRDGDWESESDLLLLEVDAETSRYRPANIIRAIRDTMQHACRCEHDCCACMQTYVGKASHLGGNRYAVRLNSYRNV